MYIYVCIYTYPGHACKHKQYTNHIDVDSSMCIYINIYVNIILRNIIHLSVHVSMNMYICTYIMPMFGLLPMPGFRQTPLQLPPSSTSGFPALLSELDRWPGSSAVKAMI